MMLIIVLLMGELEISGYVETRPYVLWQDSVLFTGYNRGWLEGKASDYNYGVQTAVDLIVPYDTTDFSGIVETITIERLALWLGPENTRVIVGKQHLYWGVGRVFRPLDIFNRTNFYEPGYERRGSAALLGYLALGTLSSLRGIIRPEKDIDNSLYGLRLGSNVFKNDIGFTTMHCPINRLWIVGGELTGELMLGYWCEYSYVKEDAVDYSKLSVGVDYSLPLGIYIMAELFFDGSGVADPAQYDFTEVASGNRTTLAQHYLYSTISTIPNPFAVIQPSLHGLVNLDDMSFVIIPEVSVSLFENTEITAGVNYFAGADDTEFKNVTPYQSAVYMWAKVFF
jgi:hypothetical protein